MNCLGDRMNGKYFVCTCARQSFRYGGCKPAELRPSPPADAELAAVHWSSHIWHLEGVWSRWSKLAEMWDKQSETLAWYANRRIPLLWPNLSLHCTDASGQKRQLHWGKKSCEGEDCSSGVSGAWEKLGLFGSGVYPIILSYFLRLFKWGK